MKEEQERSFFNPRNLSFMVMLIAVAATVMLRPQSPEVEAHRAEQAEVLMERSDRHQRLLFTFLTAEVVQSLSLSGQLKERKEEEIPSMLEMMEEQGMLKSDRAQVGRFLVLTSIEREVELPQGESELFTDLHALYLESQPPTLDSPLYDWPTSRLVELKVASFDGEEAHSVLLGEYQIWAVGVQLIVIAVTLLVLLLAAGAVVLLFVLFFRFRKNPPTLSFASVLQNIEPGSDRHRLLIESAILFLFLLFPVGAFIASEFPASQSIWFQLLYMPLIFVASQLYFIRSGGGVELGRALWYNQEGFVWWRELLWGVAGFVLIFPIAVAVLLVTLQLAAYGSGDLRFAHPIVFEIGRHPLLIFFLAAVLVPIIEEVIFRSKIYGYFRCFMRIPMASLMSGIFFAVLHPQGWVAFPYLTVMGMGLAWLREFRPAVVAPIVTHAMVNGLAVAGAWILFYS